MSKKEVLSGDAGVSEMRLDLEVDFAAIIVGILNEGQNVGTVGAHLRVRPLNSELSRRYWFSAESLEEGTHRGVPLQIRNIRQQRGPVRQGQLPPS
jgi:hypothetical protein